MLNKSYIKLIERLTSAPGAPGFEEEVTKIAATYVKENGFAETRENSIRNLYLTRHGNTGKKPMLMLDAHGDEVGFMVKSIRPDGTLQVLELGGISRQKIQGSRVKVRIASGEYIPGVIASIPPHFISESANTEIVIDIGARSKEDAIRNFGVRIGEPAVPDTPYYYNEKNNLVMAKALDCRIGCAALIAVMEILAGEELPVDIIGAITAQEEIGDRGALIAAQVIKPDVAIVFEGAPADDTFVPEDAIQTALGRGPMLRHYDTSMVSNPRFTSFAIDTAIDQGIPVQESVRSGGGTNGGCIHTYGDGVPTIVVSVPVRYVHSPCGISSYSDFCSTVELTAAIIRSLSREIVAGFHGTR